MLRFGFQRPPSPCHAPRSSGGSRGKGPARPARVWPGVLLAGTLTGCMSMAPRYEQPRPPVAAAYPADAPLGAAGPGASASATGWRDYFADARLRALITQALENSRDLRSAALRVEESRAAHGIQRADRFPSLSAGAAAILMGTPARLSTTGRASTSHYYEVGVSAGSWELDFWGRVRSLDGAALETFLASEAAQRAVLITTVAQVADDYLALRELDERLVLARLTIASRSESYRIFRLRFEVGAIAKLELTQVETLLIQAQALAAQLERARAREAHALTLLVGAAVDLTPLTSPFDDASVIRELRPGLPSDLLNDRPDIVAAEHQLRAAQGNIGAARAAYFPRVTLIGNVGTVSTDLDGLFQSGSRSWVFVPQISLPIFDGGRNRARLDLAKARRELALATYEKTIQGAFREVSDALSGRFWLAEQVRIERRALAAQQERTRLAMLRYAAGAAPYLEVLEAQRDQFDAEQQLVQTRRALLASHISLYAALGGGAIPSSPSKP